MNSEIYQISIENVDSGVTVKAESANRYLFAMGVTMDEAMKLLETFTRGQVSCREPYNGTY